MKFRFFQFLLGTFCLVFSTNITAQSADITVGCAPVTVNFTAPNNATTFFWDFKDGATSDLQKPTNLFINPGSFEVEFRTAQGGDVVGTVTINVFAKPTITIAQDPEVGCTPAVITLSNTTEIPDGINLLSSNWTFPDGTGAVGMTTDKMYNSAGNFSVNLAITTSSSNCNGAADFTDFIEIKDSPGADFSISPDATSCAAPFTVTLGNETTGDNLIYLWDLGGGNSFMGENPPNQTYSEDGDFDISLTVTNEDGCFKTITKTVSVGSPTATFKVADTVCVGTPFIIENQSSAGSYTWSVTGSASFNSSAANPQFNFSIEGIYQIALNVSAQNGACTADNTMTVFAQNLDATFAPDPTYGCSEPYMVTFTPVNPVEGAMYNWEFGDDSTSTAVNPSHDFNADNESPYDENGEFFFTTKLTVSTAAGCSAEFEVTDTLDIPLARFMPDTVSGCAPLTVEFSDSSHSTTPIVNWEWIYDDGATDNSATPDVQSHTFNEPGEYDVKLVITNELGCPDTSYAVRVEVGERVNPDFQTDETSFCPGDSIQFTDITNNPNIDEWHYYTDNDRSSHCYSIANPKIPFITETGTFEVNMVVGYNGCLDSIKKENLIEIKGPIAEIQYMMSCDTPNTVLFTSNSGDATTLSWNFGDSEIGIQEMESHDYANTGDYMVILIAENANTTCLPTTDTAFIKIRNIKADGPIDSLQCKNQPLMLNSENSTDVDTSCFRGYTWFFHHPGVRPVTTNVTTVDDVSYPDTGRYMLDLVVEDVNGCTDTARYPIIVHEAMISFEVDKTLICTPMNVGITNIVATTTSQTIESYMWDFGDGVGMSEDANPLGYTYVIDPGGDEITISVGIEDDAGCPGESSQTIGLYRPISQIIAGDLRICEGETIEFTGTDFFLNGQMSPLSYSWDFGNMTTADTKSATATYDDGGFYLVRLDYTEISTGCAGAAIINANVQDFPVAAFITDVDGAESLCAPTQVQFTDNSTTTTDLSQSWDFGNGASGVGPNAVAVFNPGTFTVTLSVQTSNGCEDEISRDFFFEEEPTGAIDFVGGSFCVGDNVTVSIRDTARVSSFSWIFEGTTFGENEASVTFQITQVPQNGQAPIRLSLKGRGDCELAVEEIIPVNSVEASFTASADPCDLIVTFTNRSPATANRFSWDFGDGSGTSTETNPVYEYSTGGTFTVTLLAENSATGCTNEFTQTVTVMLPSLTDKDEIIPNAFTPEVSSTDEGINDIFRVIGERPGLCAQVQKVNSFKVFNRWGVEVYNETNLEIEEGWDGRYKNELQPAGVYLYAIEVEFIDGSTDMLKGDVTLIR